MSKIGVRVDVIYLLKKLKKEGNRQKKIHRCDYPQAANTSLSKNNPPVFIAPCKQSSFFSNAITGRCLCTTYFPSVIRMIATSRRIPLKSERPSLKSFQLLLCMKPGSLTAVSQSFFFRNAADVHDYGLATGRISEIQCKLNKCITLSSISRIMSYIFPVMIFPSQPKAFVE